MAKGDRSILDPMVEAVAAVRERLVRSTAALEAAAVPYAVVGDIAVREWVSRANPSAARNAPAVDILLLRSDLPKAVQALESVGFVFNTGGDRVMFLDGPNGCTYQAIKVWFGGEMLNPGCPLVAPNPTEFELTPPFRSLAVRPLVNMLLASYRTVDKMLIDDLTAVGIIDRSWLASVPAEVTERLLFLLDNPEN
jgi:hypothetical protein